jgi:putative ABC transport system substrate-binding protein
MKRREFIKLIGGAAAATWPIAVQAQKQAALPVVAFLNGGTPDGSQRNAAAFRKGLSEMGLVDGRDVAVEYYWLEGQYDRVPALVGDLVRRGVAVIASPGFPPGALAAKAASTRIPIVFGVGDDPVKLGLVASIARPGGNVTGINFFVQETVSKRLALLHELVPKAIRIAVLVNPANTTTAEATLREAREAAPALGLQIAAFDAGTTDEIDRAFAAMARDRSDALLIAGDGFLFHAAWAIRHACSTRSLADDFRCAGIRRGWRAD